MADDVVLRYSADITQLRKDLQRVVGLSEDAAGKAAKKLGSEFKRTGKAATGMTVALDALADAADVVSPKLAEGVRTLRKLEVSAGLVTKGIGPLVLIAGAAAIAFNEWQEEQEKLARTQETAAAALELQLDLTRRVETANLDLAVALGEVGLEEAKILALRRSNLEQSLPGIQKLTGSITEQQAAVTELEQALDTAHARQAAFNAANDEGGSILAGTKTDASSLNAEIAILTERLEKEEAGLASVEAQRSSAVEKLRELTTAEIQAVQVKGQLTRGIDEQKEAEERLVNTLQREAEATIKVAQISSAANASLLTEEQAINAAARARLMTIDELAKAGADADDVASARAAVVAERSRELEAVELERIANVQDAEDASDAFIRDLQARRRAEALAFQEAQLSAVADLVGNTADGLETLAEIMEEQGQRGARAVFIASQAAAGAQLVVAETLAVAQAFAQLGPIGGAAATAGLLATFAGFAAKISQAEPPKFHIGTSSASRPDEFAATLQRGEVVQTSAARAIDRQNAGASSGARNVTEVILKAGTAVSRQMVITGVSGGAAQKVSKRLQGTRTNIYATSQ